MFIHLTQNKSGLIFFFHIEFYFAHFIPYQIIRFVSPTNKLYWHFCSECKKNWIKIELGEIEKLIEGFFLISNIEIGNVCIGR